MISVSCFINMENIECRQISVYNIHKNVNLKDKITPILLKSLIKGKRSISKIEPNNLMIIFFVKRTNIQ